VQNKVGFNVIIAPWQPNTFDPGLDEFHIGRNLTLVLVIIQTRALNLYTWKPDLSQLHNQKVKPKMAGREAYSWASVLVSYIYIIKMYS
jgi:hypothetical protein